MSYSCKEPDSSILDTLIDDGNGHFKGECVSLVKHQCSQIPSTSMWKQGKQVKEVKTLAKGTAIATFENGKYKGHAAIFISQDGTGIWVWDQYNHPPKGVSKRLLNFDDKRSLVNNGNKYYVID
jgi:hypothetical protein